MADNLEKGNYGEQIAAAWLERMGYEILTLNFRCPTGEIDIIAAKQGVVVFIEVKYRRSVSYGYPAEAVTLRKQRTIRAVADHYIYINKLFDTDFRFDVVQIIDSGKPVIDHIENAF